MSQPGLVTIGVKEKVCFLVQFCWKTPSYLVSYSMDVPEKISWLVSLSLRYTPVYIKTTEFSPKYSQALVVVDLDWYHALLRQYCKFLYLSKVQFPDVFENGNEQNASEVHEGPFPFKQACEIIKLFCVWRLHFPTVE